VPFGECLARLLPEGRAVHVTIVIHEVSSSPSFGFLDDRSASCRFGSLFGRG
jgi:hypothetical protein